MAETKAKTTRTKKPKASEPTEAATRVYAPLPDKPLVFMHIPKTGGHTLRAILQQVYGAAVCPAQNWDELHSVDVSAYRVFIGHFGRQIETLLKEVPDYVVFLREPRERMLSLYRYLKATQQIDPALSLMEYLQTVAPARGDDNVMTRYLSTPPNEPGAAPLISAAIRWLKVCLFVGRFEPFEISVMALADKLNWPGLTIPHLNAADDGLTKLDGLRSVEIEALTAVNRKDVEVYEFAEREIWG